MPSTAEQLHPNKTTEEIIDNTQDCIIHVIDDDEAMCASLTWLLSSMHWRVKTYSSGAQFLNEYDDTLLSCVILDVRMPGMSGLELQEILKQRGIELPIIFITGHGDVRMAVRAMKAGAMEFLNKPFNDQELVDCINRSLNYARQHRKNYEAKKELLIKLRTLTARELEILKLLAQGKLNKVIAYDLTLSIKTVELHRSNIMRKLKSPTMASLLSHLYRYDIDITTLRARSRRAAHTTPA